MLQHKAYCFRIYPTAEQEHLFRQTVGCCRLVYNLCLDQKKLERERSNPHGLTAFDQIKELTALAIARRGCASLPDVPNLPRSREDLGLFRRSDTEADEKLDNGVGGFRTSSWPTLARRIRSAQRLGATPSVA